MIVLLDTVVVLTLVLVFYCANKFVLESTACWEQRDASFLRRWQLADKKHIKF